MRDEMDGRIWSEHHEQFSNSIAKAMDAIRVALCRVYRFEFSAPWKTDKQC